MSAEERALISRASRGDVEAFSKLVAHSALVRGVTLRMRGGQEAQDASQETWVRVWANMKSFRGDSAFSTWLYRVTVNTCLSFRRKSRAAGLARSTRSWRISPSLLAAMEILRRPRSTRNAGKRSR